MFDLKNKKVFITGGSRGIGAGTARILAKLGCRVAFSYTTEESSAHQIIKDLDGEGHLAVKMDVCYKASVDEAFKKVLEEFSGLDGLVNNAGITNDQLMLRMSEEDFAKVLQTNLTGTFLCSKAVLKPMMKARKGSIVNITSIIGQMGNPGQTNYAASKAGIEAFSKSMAKEMGSRSIRVNCVAPGFIVTNMTDKMDEKQKEHLLQGTPLNRLGQVEDVAYAVAYLLSDEASYITGQTLSVNGGMYM
ncbi:MAG: 3-oxoacyl-[acyl-carrier-protein] reductase [Bdellovibrionaceae bacterium]|nr:3-oxoacyl-[acyl-carrier-protein] reductase [Pseudobdellovibrionaceae bacterium]